MSNSQLADAAFLQVASYNGEIFTDSKQNDILFYCDPHQKFLLGPKPAEENTDAPLTLAPQHVSVNVPCHISELHGTQAHFSNIHTPVFTTDSFAFENSQGRHLHISSNLHVDEHAVLANVNTNTLTASNIDIRDTMHVDGANARVGFSNVSASNMETHDISCTRAAFSQCTVDDLRCKHTLSSASIKTPQLHVNERCDVSSFIGFSRKKE